MRNTLCALLAVLCCQFAFAQQDGLFTNWGIQKMGIEARADYQREYVSGDAVKENCGFKGQYLNFRVDGKFNDKLSYSYRQRLYKAQADETFFDATDWMYLKYHVNDRLAFSAGKQVVAVGGYEYDRNPIDIYFGSEYWWNTRCYQWGVDATYEFNDGKDMLLAQVCQTPYGSPMEVNGTRYHDMYAYNLMWYGSHGWFNTMYSVNMVEYLPGKFINYIALGNRFTFGNVTLTLDLMNRTSEGHCFLARDFSVMGEIDWMPTEKVNLFGKCTYDVNKSTTLSDACVPPGTEITHFGAGVEVYPLDGSSDLRLHLAGDYTLGTVTADYLQQPKQLMLTAGLTWRMDLLGLLK